MTIVLASGSPRRRELLARLVPEFDIVPSNIAERPPLKGESPADYASELAHQKAVDVGQHRPGDVVLAADTAVAIDRTILGKPNDPNDAARMLALLRGRVHTVVTAVAVCCAGEEHARSVAAHVRMRNFTDEEITRYIASGEPMDKAGAYAVQGLGAKLVSKVTGCYNAVVGLPLCSTYELLRDCGAVHQTPPEASCFHTLS